MAPVASDIERLFGIDKKIVTLAIRFRITNMVLARIGPHKQAW